MKIRVKDLIWTCVCLSIGISLLYYLNQPTLIQENPKHDQNHQSRQELLEKVTGGSDAVKTTSTTMGNEKDMYTLKENIKTITDDKPETSSRKSGTVTKQETSKNETEQRGQTTKQNVTGIDSSKTVNTSNIDNVLQKYQPFQSAEEVEFPFTENQEPRIPHIIHQSFCDESVPEPYRGFIESFTSQNPKWQYRFWTHKSGRKLLVDRYPYLVRMFDVFGKCNYKQFDMIKYAVLHEFGGVFADFDMWNARPLDKATRKYSCIIPIEPFEHNAMRLQAKVRGHNFDLYNNSRTALTLNTEIMLCRPKHPFLQFLLTNLNSAVSYSENRDQASGSFVTASYMNYNGIDRSSFGNLSTSYASNSPNFYKGNRTEDDNDAVYIPNSQYFFDSVDPEFIDGQGHLMRCYKFEEMTHLIRVAKEACAEFERRKKVRKNRKYTFVVHYWHNSKLYDYAKWIRSVEKIHIQKIVPGCIFYE